MLYLQTRKKLSEYVEVINATAKIIKVIKYYSFFYTTMKKVVKSEIT